MISLHEGPLGGVLVDWEDDRVIFGIGRISFLVVIIQRGPKNLIGNLHNNLLSEIVTVQSQILRREKHNFFTFEIVG